MKTRLHRSIALLFLLCPLIARAVAPVNDKFATATIITGSGATFNNQNGATATADSLDPYIAGNKPTHSLWYRLDAQFNVSNNHVIITHTTSANVGVYQLQDVDGDAGALAPVTGAQAAYAGPGQDTVTFPGTPATRFYICVDTASTFTLTVQLPGQNNDLFADAIVLAGNQGSTTGSNLNCSNVGDTPANLPSPVPQSGVWYSWTPTVTAQLVVDTNFSYLAGVEEHDTVMAVYTGTTLANLVLVGSDDDSGLGSNSRVSFAATAGTKYYIWVGDYSTSQGPFNLEWFAESNAGVFDVIATSPTVSSEQGATTVQVLRHFAGTAAPAVTFTTVNGTAVAGTDFTGLTQTLNFPAGNSNNDGAFIQALTVYILPRATAGSGPHQYSVRSRTRRSIGATSASTIATSTNTLMAPDRPICRARNAVQ